MSSAHRVITQRISADATEVARFAGAPVNLPRWASGVSSQIRLENGSWVSESPMGSISIEFIGDVQSGELDHRIGFADGSSITVPMRVLPAADGCEISFTLVRDDRMTDAEFDRDVELVRNDLARLKRIVEGASQVRSYLSKLEHARAHEVRRLVEAIDSAFAELELGIKWNAPSFALDGTNIVTLRVSTSPIVQVILHVGSKKLAAGIDLRFDVADCRNRWADPTRCVIELDPDAHQRPVLAAIREWIPRATSALNR